MKWQLCMVLVVLLALLPFSVLLWSSLQVIKSLFMVPELQGITEVEKILWGQWEQRESHHPDATHLVIPTYTRENISIISSLDFRLPFLLSNFSDSNVLTIETLTTSPLKELSIDYFSDARKKLLVPDSNDQLGIIMEKILSGGPEKVGSQMIIQSYPEIMRSFLRNNFEWLKLVFGENRVMAWMRMGLTMTVPVFISTGFGVENDGEGVTTRTDLHCEPISNVVIQTYGSKKWTLVEPQYSRLLKPTVSPDGRAYFFSNIDPSDPMGLSHVPRYEVITNQGDILYVPSWMWHKVEYLPSTTAVSMSLFEFLGLDFVFNNPVFAFTIMPNLIKEAIGLKTQ